MLKEQSNSSLHSGMKSIVSQLVSLDLLVYLSKVLLSVRSLECIFQCIFSSKTVWPHPSQEHALSWKPCYNCHWEQQPASSAAKPELFHLMHTDKCVRLCISIGCTCLQHDARLLILLGLLHHLVRVLCPGIPELKGHKILVEYYLLFLYPFCMTCKMQDSFQAEGRYSDILHYIG